MTERTFESTPLVRAGQVGHRTTACTSVSVSVSVSVFKSPWAKGLWISTATIVGAIGSVGCNRIPEPEPPAASQQALTQNAPQHSAEPATPPPPASPDPAPKPKPSSDFIGYPKEGWTKVKLQDTVPLCVFSDYLEREKAPFLDQVKKQQLKADKSVVFGAFGPHCINEKCDDLPSLQCTVDREGDTLIVRSRYIAYHKDGATCTDECREVTAACESPKLDRGTYAVRYGENMYTLKIPSVMRSPCLKAEEKTKD